MQHEIPMIRALRGPEMVPKHYVAMCKTSGEAVLLAITFGKKTARQVANVIGMEPAQMSRILSSNAHMPADKAVDFANAVGNWGWQQWVAFGSGMDLVPRRESPEERMARLETENEILRAGVAA